MLVCLRRFFPSDIKILKITRILKKSDVKLDRDISSPICSNANDVAILSPRNHLMVN